MRATSSIEKVKPDEITLGSEQKPLQLPSPGAAPKAPGMTGKPPQATNPAPGAGTQGAPALPSLSSSAVGQPLTQPAKPPVRPASSPNDGKAKEDPKGRTIEDDYKEYQDMPGNRSATGVKKPSFGEFIQNYQRAGGSMEHLHRESQVADAVRAKYEPTRALLRGEGFGAAVRALGRKVLGDPKGAGVAEALGQEGVTGDEALGGKEVMRNEKDRQAMLPRAGYPSPDEMAQRRDERWAARSMAAEQARRQRIMGQHKLRQEEIRQRATEAAKRDAEKFQQKSKYQQERDAAKDQQAKAKDEKWEPTYRQRQQVKREESAKLRAEKDAETAAKKAKRDAERAAAGSAAPRKGSAADLLQQLFAATQPTQPTDTQPKVEKSLIQEGERSHVTASSLAKALQIRKMGGDSAAVAYLSTEIKCLADVSDAQAEAIAKDALGGDTDLFDAIITKGLKEPSSSETDASESSGHTPGSDQGMDDEDEEENPIRGEGKVIGKLVTARSEALPDMGKPDQHQAMTAKAAYQFKDEPSTSTREAVDRYKRVAAVQRVEAEHSKAAEEKLYKASLGERMPVSEPAGRDKRRAMGSSEPAQWVDPTKKMHDHSDGKAVEEGHEDCGCGCGGDPKKKWGNRIQKLFKDGDGAAMDAGPVAGSPVEPVEEEDDHHPRVGMLGRVCSKCGKKDCKCGVKKSDIETTDYDSRDPKAGATGTFVGSKQKPEFREMGKFTSTDQHVRGSRKWASEDGLSTLQKLNWLAKSDRQTQRGTYQQFAILQKFAALQKQRKEKQQ